MFVFTPIGEEALFLDAQTISDSNYRILTPSHSRSSTPSFLLPFASESAPSSPTPGSPITATISQKAVHAPVFVPKSIASPTPGSSS